MPMENPFVQPIEKINSAALRFKNQIFTGTTHTDCIINLAQRFPDWHDFQEEIEEGFITNQNRFVDRDLAGKIADNAHQLDHLLESERLNQKDFLDASGLGKI